jgi:hypothetical protein
MITLCIVLMFLLLRVINRGNLRSAGISRFIAKPLRSCRFPSLASASFDPLQLRWMVILGYYCSDRQCFAKDLWEYSDARLVTSLSLPSSILSATPGGRIKARLITLIRVACAHFERISTHLNFTFLGAKGQIQGTHPLPRWSCTPPLMWDSMLPDG